MAGSATSEFVWPISATRNLLGAQEVVEEDEVCPIPEGLAYIDEEFSRGGVKRWYKYVTTAGSHSSARQVCQNAGGHLVTFKKQVEYDWMIQVAGRQ